MRISLGLAMVASISFCDAEPMPAFSDSFDRDLSQWVPELEAGGAVSIIDGQLDINSEKGCTVWFRSKLSGRIHITYTATMVDQGGAYDRVSDLNCFWMATDPKQPENIFSGKPRNGIFKKYNKLQLYYVGDGGGNNTTTRLRRYAGDGKRPLLPQHDLKGGLYTLPANQLMHIEIRSDGPLVQYIRDGKLIFEMHDENPFTQGWFGFRTLRSHIKIDNFKVFYNDKNRNIDNEN